MPLTDIVTYDYDYDYDFRPARYARRSEGDSRGPERAAILTGLSKGPRFDAMTEGAGGQIHEILF